nr:hypothetical protein [Tanacetum cinerariifolium]
MKSSLQLVDEPHEEQDQPEAVPEPQGAGEEYDLERDIQISMELFQAQGQAHVSGVAIREPVAEATRPLPVVEGKGKAIVTEEQAAQSLLALHTPKRKIRETSSPVDAETDADTDRVIGEGDTDVLDIDGSDPGKTPESRPPPEDDKMDEDRAGLDPRKSHVALTGPNPEPMHDDFVATVYPKVHESLKFLADEHVILEDPPSSSGTLSSIKILDDTYTLVDQFFNDKSAEDEPGKQNVDAKVISMKSQTLDNTTQNLGSRVFTLELRDLPHKINQTVNEVVKEAVHIALQAPLRDLFRELPEADMKEIIH